MPEVHVQLNLEDIRSGTPFTGRNTLETEDQEWFFIGPTGRYVELGLCAELHNRAAKGIPVIDDDFPIAEYILEFFNIHID